MIKQTYQENGLRITLPMEWGKGLGRGVQTEGDRGTSVILSRVKKMTKITLK